MGIQDINNAAAAQNALTVRLNSFLDSIDADIATRRAAYDALASDLNEVVEDKLTQLIYMDASTGSDENPGTSTYPLVTLAEAFRRLTPGSRAEIRLRRGDTYQVGRDELQCRLDNGFVTMQVWGDIALDKPIIEQVFTNLNGAGYSSGFAGSGLNLHLLSCKIISAMNVDDLPMTGFNGVFTSTHNSSVAFHSCDFEVGDVNVIQTGYGEPVHVSLRSCDIARRVGSVGHMISASAGILRSTSTTLPEGETWADLVNGQIYAADGEATNFITNVQI